MREDLITLEGISKGDVAALGEDLRLSDISVDTSVDDKFKSLIARCFRAQPLEIVALRGGSRREGEGDVSSEEAALGVAKTPAAEFGLRLRLLFEPLRTFTTRVEVVVVCRNRGKWRLQIDLDATEPEPDDRIKMCAAVGLSFLFALVALL